jgi:predicted  nucleic acid-binding Zn-ribbon protein
MLLIQLQNLVLGGDYRYRECEGRIGCLRSYIPEAYLSQFDRLLRVRRMAVAPLTETDTCGGCLLRVPAARSLTIRRHRNRLHTCQYCGCFLYAHIFREEDQTPLEAFSSRSRHRIQ